MARMGRDSERAAMIFLHQTRGADLVITVAVDEHVKSAHRHGDLRHQSGLRRSVARGGLA